MVFRQIPQARALDRANPEFYYAEVRPTFEFLPWQSRLRLRLLDFAPFYTVNVSHRSSWTEQIGAWFVPSRHKVKSSFFTRIGDFG